MSVGRVAQLCRHPVKSMQGEAADAARLGRRGLAGDRRCAVAAVASGKVLSAKREPRLLEGRARLVDDRV